MKKQTLRQTQRCEAMLLCTSWLLTKNNRCPRLLLPTLPLQLPLHPPLTTGAEEDHRGVGGRGGEEVLVGVAASRAEAAYARVCAPRLSSGDDGGGPPVLLTHQWQERAPRAGR